ncbi:unnamed protein product [Spirodela intermedia]|uniref:Uncharacterized protein n=1 Tax=Spirodela intermedia TaxID=51605 RepID=A0A7I8IYA2_SPIIN|nr:unnamed protein product [Spirodela intermedia]CAA6662779.1 unnamed protein product [Spirodela intermedia]
MAATTTAALGKASALPMAIAALLVAAVLAPGGTAGLSKLTLLEGPDCGGTATTHRCGFHYEEGHPLLTLTFPVRGGGRRLLSPIASRYARDAVVCGVRETQFA